MARFDAHYRRGADQRRARILPSRGWVLGFTAASSSSSSSFRAGALCASAGFRPSPLILRRLLQQYARLGYAPGVHACVRDIQALTLPLSDTVIAGAS